MSAEASTVEEARFRSLPRLLPHGAAHADPVAVPVPRRARTCTWSGWSPSRSIYLVVWTTIADQHGGAVRGSRAGQFAAYYIVWTLVRNMNIVFTPYGWEWRIREGELSAQLLRPLHPIHYDIARFAGRKVVVDRHLAADRGRRSGSRSIPSDLHPRALEVVVFLVAIWGAYLIRTMNLTSLGMVTFWTTRASAIFELVVRARAAPLGPARAAAADAALGADVADVAAVQVDVLLPDPVPRRRHVEQRSCSSGLGMQLLWIAICSGLVPSSSGGSRCRHYSAVGN